MDEINAPDRIREEQLLALFLNAYVYFSFQLYRYCVQM